MPGLKILTVLALALLVYGVVDKLDDVAAAKPTYAFDLPTPKRITSATPAGFATLRFALVWLGMDSEAILDAGEVRLIPGQEFTASVGFRTPQAGNQNSAFRRFGTSIAQGKDWRSKIRQSRELPAWYGGLELQLDMKGIYHGAHESTHLLTLENLDGHGYEFRPGGYGGGTMNLMGFHAAMTTDVPIARIYLKDNLALLAVVTTDANDVLREVGKRTAWANQFRAGLDAPDVTDRQSIVDAVRGALPAHRGRDLTSDDFLDYGRLIDGLGAAYALREVEMHRTLRARCKKDATLLARARTAGLPENPKFPTAWFLDQAGKVWHQFMKDWMADRPPANERGSQGSTQTMRLLGMTQEPALADELADQLVEGVNYFNMRGFVMKHEDFGTSDAGRAAFQRVRSAAIGQLPLPWNLAFRSWFTLLVYSLLPLFAALLVAVVRPVPQQPRIAVTNGLVLLIAIGSFVSLCEFPLSVLLAPVWWILTIRWMREPVSHGLLERGFVWLTLSLVAIDALQDVKWYVNSPPIDYAASFGSLFAWILLALWVRRDGRWRRPERFVLALWMLLGIDGLSTFGPSGTDTSMVAIVFLVLFVVFLLGFLAGGQDAEHPPEIPEAAA